MGGWVDGWMGGWVDGWMGGWVDGWMGGWVGGRVGGQASRTHFTMFSSLRNSPVSARGVRHVGGRGGEGRGGEGRGGVPLGSLSPLALRLFKAVTNSSKSRVPSLFVSNMPIIVSIT